MRKQDTRKPSAKMAPRKTVREKRAESTARATSKRKEAKAPSIDVAGLYSDTLDVIEKRQGIDNSGLDVAPPISTGLLQVDQILGGGIRACMLTGAGNEQCAKTTLALTAMAGAIKENIPLIAFVDYEGCVTRDTQVMHGNLRQSRLDELFDFTKASTWKPGTWVDVPPRHDILTVAQHGHYESYLDKRSATLYYKGTRETLQVSLSSGHTLRGHGHLFYVYDENARRFTVVRMEDLRPGETVMVSLSAAPVPETFTGSKRFRYLSVSNLGSVLYKGYILPVYRKGHPDAYVMIPTDGEPEGYNVASLVYATIVDHKYKPKRFSEKTDISFLDGNPGNLCIYNLRNTKEGALVRYVRVTKQEFQAFAKSKSIANPWIDNMLSDHAEHHEVALCDSREKPVPEELVFVDGRVPSAFQMVKVHSVIKTGLKEHVYDLTLSGVGDGGPNGDPLPRSIVTNGIITHNSTKNSKPYVQSILKGSGVNLSVDQVFGRRNKDTGEWDIQPRVRYRSETILERFYDWLSQVLRELPDKRYVGGKWWLVFDDKNKKHIAKVGEFADKEMQRKYGKGLWVPAPNDKVQGMIFVDSYTAMNPEVKDEESISNQMAVKASAFSKQLERVKGRMADKMVTVYGLNHLRSNPGAMFGPTEDEKGGNALKQFSDVRLRQTSRSLSGPKAYFSPKPGKKGGKATYNEIEPSVEYPGSKDEYRYVHIKAIKNKLWTPHREGWLRIWVEDGAGTARGIDPFFDTMAFLKDTGQVKGNRGNLKLDLVGLGPASRSTTWGDMKRWVLGDKETMTKISKSLGYAPMSLRSFCFKQMKNGVAEDLYNRMRSSKDQSGGDDGDDEA